MRKIMILLLVVNTSLFAQTELNSKIIEATVYRQNAELVNEASGKVPAGTSEIIIRDISTNINPASLQVALKSISKVSLLSASFEVDYLNSNKLSAEQEEWKDKLEDLNTKLRWSKEQKQIYYDLEIVLNENKKLGGVNIGLSPTDLMQLLDLYKSKQYEYNAAFLKFEKEERALAIEVSKVQSQLNAANTKANKPTGILKLQVSAVAPATVDFRCAYIVSNAGWEPIYDLRSEGITKPVDLIYKANIYQNTGYNWDRVDLVVSTGNPVQNNNRPILNPLYVNYKTVYATQSYNYKRIETSTINMAYADESMEMEEIAVGDYEDGYRYDNQALTSQFSTQYEISLPQSVTSNGKYHLVGLETYELKSEYAYHAVPKLDAAAFLLVKVSDWGQYNLLPGTANIFFEGAYVGQSLIDPNFSSDTLLISLGRDNGIKITRNELKDFTSTKLVGSNKRETYAYEIEIRNNKAYGISIEILDQVPVSADKEIQVEIDDLGNAVYNTSLGKLEWNIQIEPNQSKKLKFIYSVKYPKDQLITGQK
jgi:uncharacterized protein (TIGR02231 family)